MLRGETIGQIKKQITENDRIRDVELKKHNRYDYSPITERADYDWPEGKRLAVYFGLNIEHFSFGEGLGHTPTNPGTQPDVRNFSWRDYGLRVGIWRIQIQCPKDSPSCLAVARPEAGRAVYRSSLARQENLANTGRISNKSVYAGE